MTADKRFLAFAALIAPAVEQWRRGEAARDRTTSERQITRYAKQSDSTRSAVVRPAGRASQAHGSTARARLEELNLDGVRIVPCSYDPGLEEIRNHLVGWPGIAARLLQRLQSGTRTAELIEHCFHHSGEVIAPPTLPAGAVIFEEPDLGLAREAELKMLINYDGRRESEAKGDAWHRRPDANRLYGDDELQAAKTPTASEILNKPDQANVKDAAFHARRPHRQFRRCFRRNGRRRDRRQAGAGVKIHDDNHHRRSVTEVRGDHHRRPGIRYGARQSALDGEGEHRAPIRARSREPTPSTWVRTR